MIGWEVVMLGPMSFVLFDAPYDAYTPIGSNQPSEGPRIGFVIMIAMCVFIVWVLSDKPNEGAGSQPATSASAQTSTVNK